MAAMALQRFVYSQRFDPCGSAMVIQRLLRWNLLCPVLPHHSERRAQGFPKRQQFAASGHYKVSAGIGHHG